MELWDRYFEDRSEANKLALFNHYKANRLVIKVAGSVLKRIPKSAMVTEDDLESAGDWALYNCIDRFDPDQGVKFTTFAGNRVRGAMLDWIRSADWVSRRGREAQREGAETPEMCSLEALTGWQDSGREEVADFSDEMKKVCRCLNHLQRRLLDLLYIQGLPVDAVAARMGMTPARVSALRNEIIERVRAASRSMRPVSQLC